METTNWQFCRRTISAPVSFRAGSDMIWAFISNKAYTDVISLLGVLLPIQNRVVPYFHLIVVGVILMHNHVKPPTRCAYGKCISEWCGICSPDIIRLNTIWDHLQRSVCHGPAISANPRKLIWKKFKQLSQNFTRMRLLLCTIRLQNDCSANRKLYTMCISFV